MIQQRFRIAAALHLVGDAAATALGEALPYREKLRTIPIPWSVSAKAERGSVSVQPGSQRTVMGSAVSSASSSRPSALSLSSSKT